MSEKDGMDLSRANPGVSITNGRRAFRGGGDYHLLASSPLVERGYDPVASDGLAGLDRSGGPLGSVSLFAAGLAASTWTVNFARSACDGT